MKGKDVKRAVCSLAGEFYSFGLAMSTGFWKKVQILVVFCNILDDFCIFEKHRNCMHSPGVKIS